MELSIYSLFAAAQFSVSDCGGAVYMSRFAVVFALAADSVRVNGLRCGERASECSQASWDVVEYV